jgi:phosphatidylethanolamine/phosphatidyl-N-methylethanolamine N-methyltransferase
VSLVRSLRIMSNDRMMFFQRFLRYPWRVGAVAPSSGALARQMVAPVPGTGHPVVVELGPGTGAFTDAIQRCLGGRGYHLAVEIDPVFAGVLRRRFPSVDVVVAGADRLPEVLALRGLRAADVVVSGLPWAVLPPVQAARIMAGVAASMTPQGAFTTFAYVHALWTPAARRLRRDLRRTFEEVVPGRTVWANLPAALVYHARRPRPQSGGGEPGGLTGRKSSPISPSRWARMPA